MSDEAKEVPQGKHPTAEEIKDIRNQITPSWEAARKIVSIPKETKFLGIFKGRTKNYWKTRKETTEAIFKKGQETKEKQKELDKTQEELTDEQRKRKEAEELAEVDSLTGLLNRRGMERKIGEEIARAKREKDPQRKFAVFYLDLNNLGLINNLSADQHTAGDIVLKALAGIISYKARPGDIVARVGGDEFVVILESTDIEGGLKYWERKDTEIKEYKNGVNGSGSIWVSAGLAEANINNINEKIQTADRALRMAKNESKKRADVINVIKTEKDLPDYQTAK